MGYVKGEEFTKRKTVEFNPGSRQHIAQRLAAQRGWVPQDFTPDGQAKVDETVLELLPWPEAKLLSEYFLVTKRLGQCATGKEASIKAQKKDRRASTGASTRMARSLAG